MAGIFDRMLNADVEDEVMERLEQDEPVDEEETDSAAAADPADESRTHQRVRETVQELLKYGLLEESHKPNLYRIALAHVEEVSRILEPLDLDMGIDEVRGWYSSWCGKPRWRSKMTGPIRWCAGSV